MSDAPRCAVVLLIYKELGIIRRCVESVLAAYPGCDLYLVENASDQSEAIRAYVRAGIADGRFAGALFSDVNAINSLILALANDAFGLRGRYEVCVLSDGDLEVPPGVFEAQLEAMRDGRRACCGTALDIRAWDPADASYAKVAKHTARVWDDQRAGKAVSAARGGFWMRMYRTQEVLDVLEVFEDSGVRLRDGALDRFYETALGKEAVYLTGLLSIELTHGPMRSAGYIDEKKSLRKSIRREGAGLDLYNNDLPAEGELVLRAAAGITSRHVRYAPRTPCTPEAPATLAEAGFWPRIEALGPGDAAVATRFDPAAAVTYQLLEAPPFARPFVHDGGRRAAFPLRLLADDEAATPFLENIHVDLRGASPRREGFLATLFRAARKAALPGARVHVVFPHWEPALAELVKREQDMAEAIAAAPSSSVDALLEAVGWKTAKRSADVLSLIGRHLTLSTVVAAARKERFLQVTPGPEIEDPSPFRARTYIFS